MVVGLLTLSSLVSPKFILTSICTITDAYNVFVLMQLEQQRIGVFGCIAALLSFVLIPVTVLGFPYLEQFGYLTLSGGELDENSPSP